MLRCFYVPARGKAAGFSVARMLVTHIFMIFRLNLIKNIQPGGQGGDDLDNYLHAGGIL